MSDNPYASPLDAGFPASDSPPSHERAELATRSQRLGGAIVDIMINLVAAIPLFSLLILPTFDTLIEELRSISSLKGGSLQETLVSTGISTAMFFVVHGYLLTTRGQTIGKLLVGTRIVDQNTYELVPLGRLFVLRYLMMGGIRVIPGVGRLISLVNVLLIFRQDHKCLHDEFCGTIVVRAR